MEEDRRPLLVVVTGPPASGKTSVARELACRLSVAFVSKDTFKEVLYERFGSGETVEPVIEDAALAALLRLARAQLAAGVPFIVESDFDARADTGPLRAVAEETAARIAQVHCTRAPERLLEEFAERAASGERHPGHGDEPADVVEIRADLDAGRWDPLRLPGPVVEVDVDENVDAAAVLERLGAASVRR